MGTMVDVTCLRSLLDLTSEILYFCFSLLVRI
jgi:hypothetical protein